MGSKNDTCERCGGRKEWSSASHCGCRGWPARPSSVAPSTVLHRPSPRAYALTSFCGPTGAPELLHGRAFLFILFVCFAATQRIKNAVNDNAALACVSVKSTTSVQMARRRYRHERAEVARRASVAATRRYVVWRLCRAAMVVATLPTRRLFQSPLSPRARAARGSGHPGPVRQSSGVATANDGGCRPTRAPAPHRDTQRVPQRLLPPATIRRFGARGGGRGGGKGTRCRRPPSPAA